MIITSVINTLPLKQIMSRLRDMFSRRATGELDKPRSDRPKRLKQILDEQIEAGLHEFNRSSTGLFISAFAAGLEVGFSILFMGTIYSMFGGSLSTEVLHLFLALCYPIGF